MSISCNVIFSTKRLKEKGASIPNALNPIFLAGIKRFKHYGKKKKKKHFNVHLFFFSVILYTYLIITPKLNVGIAPTIFQ